MLFLSLRPTQTLSRICTRCSFFSTSLRLGNSKGAGTPSSNPPSARSQEAESRLRAEIVGPEAKPGELLPLSRPLGVTERPTTVLKTRTDKIKELMDKDVRMAQRRHLFVSLYPLLLLRLMSVWACRIKEAGKGYFHDMNMTRKHGGKTWVAPNVLIREDVSVLF